MQRSTRRLERWAARHVEYLPAFPFNVTDAAVTFNEIRSLRVQPVIHGNFPPVEITIVVQARLAGHMRRKSTARAKPDVLLIDVEIRATGNVRSDGSYEITPTLARMKSWER